MKQNLIIFIIIFFYGCTTIGGLNTNEILSLKYGLSIQDTNKITNNNYIYRLDFVVRNKKYIYETFTDTDTSKYYGMLFENELLVSVVNLDAGSGHFPSIKSCTSFPIYNDNVIDCLEDYNDILLSDKINLQSNSIKEIDEYEKDKQSLDSIGGITEVALYSILLSEFFIPIAIVSIPFVVDSGSKDDKNQIKFNVGDDIRTMKRLINALPDKAKMISEGDGSFYIPIGTNERPKMAIGIADYKIVWIDSRPVAACKQKNIFGPYYKCKIGY